MIFKVWRGPCSCSFFFWGGGGGGGGGGGKSEAVANKRQ